MLILPVLMSTEYIFNNVGEIYKRLSEKNITEGGIFEEMIRLQKVKKIFKDETGHIYKINDKSDRKTAYRLMKEKTDGKFPGDKEFFIELFEKMLDVNMFEVMIYFTDQLQNIKAKTIEVQGINWISSYEYVDSSGYFKDLIDRFKFKNVAVVEPSHLVRDLDTLTKNCPNVKFTLFIADETVKEAFEIAFSDRENVKIKKEKADYKENKLDVSGFDLTIINDPFLRFERGEWHHEYDFKKLWDNIIMGATSNSYFIIFYPVGKWLGKKFATLKKDIADNFKVLAINTIYLKTGKDILDSTLNILEVQNTPPEEDYEVKVFNWIFSKGSSPYKYYFDIKMSDLKRIDRWVFDSINNFKESKIPEYNNSKIEKIEIGKIADVIRGKTYFSDEKDRDNIKKVHRVTLSALSEDGIKFNELSYVFIPEDNESYAKCLLRDGDLVMSGRGTNLKMVIAHPSKEEEAIIDGNLIIIRPNSEYEVEFIKLFFESEIGRNLLNIINTGKNSVIIAPALLSKIEIPKISKEEQRSLIEEQKKYLKAIKEAKYSYENFLKNIDRKFLKGRK